MRWTVRAVLGALLAALLAASATARSPQPEVSHFSMLQAPRQFTDDVVRFLARKWQ
jgi:hypothetical protein